MYHRQVQPVHEAVLAYIKKHALIAPGDRVGVAVSGGADSVALLRLLLDLRDKLGIVLTVVHFNHQLRGAESEADQCFVADLAQQHNLEFHCASGNVPEHAAAQRLSLETAAREMRYRYFHKLLGKDLTRIATAHTLDDQAETVLLRMVRGAGTRGLAGIYPQLKIQRAEGVRKRAIIRPLLSVRRKDLETYLNALGQPWREDSSNRDLRHARNRVRHEILPCLERNLNPAVREVLAETAEIARAEEDHWHEKVKEVLALARTSNGHAGGLKVVGFPALSLALQRRVLRAAAESLGLRLEFRHVEQILGLLSEGTAANRSTVLPHDWRAFLKCGELRFEPTRPLASQNFEFLLPVPGSIDVRQLGSRFEALLVSASDVYNPEHLLDRDQLSGQELCVRNWRPGDVFWPPHTKAPKKIKELLQQRHITGPERKLWPVVVSGAQVVWMRGFPVRNQFQAVQGHDAVSIREIRLVNEITK